MQQKKCMIEKRDRPTLGYVVNLRNYSGDVSESHFKYHIHPLTPDLYVSRSHGLEVYYGKNDVYMYDTEVYEKFKKLHKMYITKIKSMLEKLRERKDLKPYKQGAYCITDLHGDSLSMGYLYRIDVYDNTFTLFSFRSDSYFFTTDWGSFYKNTNRQPNNLDDCFMIDKSDYDTFVKEFKKISKKLTELIESVYVPNANNFKSKTPFYF